MQESELHTTAILVFAHSSEEEIKHKKIAKGGLLFDVLNRHVLDVSEKSGLPYFHFSEERQRGNSFGERFTDAIQYVFDQGFDNVITIGNDTPQLKASHILKTITLLHQNKLVLGPSADGGFYLMGLQKTGFDPSAFKNLPWQTSHLGNALKEQATYAASNIVQLERLHDIDTEADLGLLIKFTRNLHVSIYKILIALITLSIEIRHVIIMLVKELYFIKYQNKGSPIYQKG